MTTAEVIAKVQKLLALGKSSPYAGESENALAAANKLLIEHGLAMADVERSDESAWKEGVVWMGSARPSVCDAVAIILEEHFFVRAVLEKFDQGVDPRTNRARRCRFEVRLFGRPEHVAMGSYAYIFLTRTFKRLWTIHRNNWTPPLSGDEARSYYLGCALGYGGKLFRQRQEMEKSELRNESGLIAVGAQLQRMTRELEDAVKGQYPEMGLAKSPGRDKGSAATLIAGMKDGATVEMNRPLPSPARSQMRIGNVG